MQKLFTRFGNIYLPIFFLLWATCVHSQNLAVKPIRIVVGPGPDVLARIIADKWSETYGSPIIVDQKPAAGGIVAGDFVAKSPNDGTTLLLTTGSFTINSVLQPGAPYQFKRDLSPVSLLATLPFILVVNQNSPFNNLQSLISFAKLNPNKLNYASAGNGTPPHLSGEMLKQMAGINMVHVPYKTAATGMTDLLGGQVDLMFDAVTTMTDYARAGTVRGLATTGTVRSEILPDMPTMSEAGVSGYETTIWLGLMAPKVTPVSVINWLNSTITAIVTRPEIKKQWAEKGAMPLTMSPLEFQHLPSYLG